MFTIINGAKLSQEEEANMNLVFAQIGGLAGIKIPWFKLAWAATDFIRDPDPDTHRVKEYPRCFHERQDCYHLLKFESDASAYGGEYMCILHLLDRSTCPTHKIDGRTVPKEGESCLCTAFEPNPTTCSEIMGRINRNRQRDRAAAQLAKEQVKRKHEQAYQDHVDSLWDPMQPTYTGRLPEDSHPHIRHLLEEYPR